MRTFFEFLDLESSGLAEVTAIDTGSAAGGVTKGVVATGLFDSVDKAVDAAMQLDDEGQWSIYACLNPLRPAGRRTNEIQRKPRRRARDADVVHVGAVRIDIDPVSRVRPCLSEEMEACRQVAYAILDSVPPAVGAAVVATGNGFAVIFKTHLEPTEENKSRLKAFTGWVARGFSTEDVHIDRGVSNFSGLTALPGTTKRKLVGLDTFTAQRPARRVELLDIRAETAPEAFEAFLASVPQSLDEQGSVQLTLPETSVGASVRQLCPGWLRVYREVGRAPGTLKGDESASGVAFHLVRAMRARTRMTAQEITEGIWERDRQMGTRHYRNLRHAAGDVNRVLSMKSTGPSCKIALDRLGPDAPCTECPEWLFRPHGDEPKTVVVRKGLPRYTRPDIGDRGREFLGESLEQVRDGIDELVEDFIRFGAKHHRPGEAYDTSFLLRISAGGGKTHALVDVVRRFAHRPDMPRMLLFTDKYDNALSILTMLDSERFALFHPKLPPGGRSEIEGFCDLPDRIESARAAGEQDEYAAACKNCQDRSTCRYRAQLHDERSFVTVHDQAPTLIGPFADRGNLPNLVFFDESPRRLHKPDMEAIPDATLRALAAVHPEAHKLTVPLLAASHRNRGGPVPTVHLLPELQGDKDIHQLLDELVALDLPKKAAVLLRALRLDIEFRGPSYRVWTPPVEHGLGHQAFAGVVEFTNSRLHREAVVVVLDATADPVVLERGLGRQVLVDWDDVQPRCEVVQVPIDTSRAALRRNTVLKSQLLRLIGHHLENRTEDEPLGVIGYKDFIGKLRERHANSPLVTSYFGGLRGTNEFVDRGVRDLALVGVPIPNLTDFSIRGATVVQQHTGVTPDLVHSSKIVNTGLEWRGMQVGERALSYHDDDLARLLDQECAAEMYQAAFRIRPLENGSEKRVWLIGRQPVWDLPVTRMLTLKEAFDEAGHPLQGRQRGRPPSQRQKAIDFLKKHAGNATLREIMAETGVSEATAKRARREFRIASTPAPDHPTQQS